MKKLFTIISGVIFTVLGIILTRVSGETIIVMTKEAVIGYVVILLGAFFIFECNRVVAFWKSLSSEEDED